YAWLHGRELGFASPRFLCLSERHLLINLVDFHLAHGSNWCCCYLSAHAFLASLLQGHRHCFSGRLYAKTLANIIVCIIDTAFGVEKLRHFHCHEIALFVDEVEFLFHPIPVICWIGITAISGCPAFPQPIDIGMVDPKNRIVCRKGYNPHI